MAGLGASDIRANLAASVQRMTGPQRLTLAFAFMATVGAMFAVSRLTGGTPLSTLYADLEPEAAAAVVDQLEAQAVSYELLDGGRVIQVPTDQVHALRLDLSSQGLPGGGDGWSILDDQGITTSQFDQRVGYQRAMEGELARTISAIDGVDDVNVHLVIPEDDLFAGDEVQASASVLLVTAGADAVSPTQVQAIVNLVSSSVEGMTPGQVSVTDQSGRILAAPGDGAGTVGLEGDGQLRSRREYEAGLETELESLLAAVVGPGLAVVTVAADLDFDTVQTTTEQYEPTQSGDGVQSVLSETTRAEVYRGDEAATETGVLGTETPTAEDLLSDDPAIAAAVEDVRYVLDERDATYAMNKVVTSSEQAPGEVRSLSVAVLLDESALDATRLAEVEQLVAAAAGIDADRGDTLAVSLLPINETVRATIEAANTPAEVEGAGMDLIGLARTVGTVVVALVVILFGLKSLKGGGRRRVLDSIPLSELEGQMAALGTGTGGTGAVVPPETRLQTLIANQPDDVAGVLRSWLTEAEAVR
jgi:flagellar M-ring protein FliF